MELELELPIKPISYNAYYKNTKQGFRVKTGAGKAYDQELLILLEDYADALVAFGLSLPSNNIVKMKLRFANPNFFIKDGSRISKTAGDVDNIVKVLQDKLFSVMQLDDYVCRWIDVADFPADNYMVFISLTPEEIPPFIHIEGQLLPA